MNKQSLKFGEERSLGLVHQPMKLEESQLFTEEHHRHTPPLKRHMFTIAAYEVTETGIFIRRELRGIATVDRCSSAWSSYSDRLEIRRLCVTPDAPKNTCSFLLGKCKQAVFSMGYKVLVTYTQFHESGASLKAAGFMITQRAAIWRLEDGSIGGGLVRWIAEEGRRPSKQDRDWTDDVLAENQSIVD